MILIKIKHSSKVWEKNNGLMPFEGHQNIDVVEVGEDDDDLSHIGDKLKDFCGDLQLYKMVESEEVGM